MPAYSVRKPLSVEEKNALGLSSDLVSHLLFHRGITDAVSADTFLTPSYDRDIHDPFLLKDAEKAARRIIQAIKSDEKIAIYADYDADGIPGAVIWNDFFVRISFKNFIIYIPHRHDEGFGLNVEAVNELVSQGVKLIVTVDCGISDVVPVAHANSKGLEVIITDHHEAPAHVPPAYAIVDHKQVDCMYPDKFLCGSGVAFKLIRAILKIERFGLKEGMEKWLLDLVGMATLSDMVPLIGENRVLAQYGLNVLRKSQRLGLVRLLAKLKIPQKYITEDDIGFMISPRINAASRMGVPMDAFKLLSAQTEEDAKFFADHLDEINNERKGMVAALVKDVKKKVHERHGDVIPHAIVLGNPEWRPSLLGLAANSCAEEFKRPVFLWGRDGGDVIKGSCRSEGTSNVVEIMKGALEGTFLQFGGHHHSGGFAVGNDAIHFLDSRLNESAKKISNIKSQILNQTNAENVKEAEEIGQIIIDKELSIEDVMWSLFDDISKLAPFGVGNPRPVFLFKNIVADSVRIFGKTNNHVEIIFKKKSGAKIPAIAFFAAPTEWAKNLKANTKINLIASVEKSMFRGRPELRLRVIEVV